MLFWSGIFMTILFYTWFRALPCKGSSGDVWEMQRLGVADSESSFNKIPRRGRNPGWGDTSWKELFSIILSWGYCSIHYLGKRVIILQGSKRSSCSSVNFGQVSGIWEKFMPFSLSVNFLHLWTVFTSNNCEVSLNMIMHMRYIQYNTIYYLESVQKCEPVIIICVFPRAHVMLVFICGRYICV